MADIITWVTVVFGTIVGAMMALMAGPAKLLPFHPMNRAMSYAFSNVWGPFLGLPGTPLRIIIGLGQLVAGIGLLVGIWGDVLGAYDKKLSDLAKALVIDAGLAIFISVAMAALMHKYVDKSPGMPAIIAVLALIFTLLRIFFVGPDHIPNQIIATVIGVLIMIPVIIVMAINKSMGVHESVVEEENKKFHEMEAGKA